MINISPSNISQNISLQVKYFQNRQACFGRSECEWVKGKIGFPEGDFFHLRKRESLAKREYVWVRVIARIYKLRAEIVSFWGILSFKGDQNILRFQPCAYIYLTLKKA